MDRLKDEFETSVSPVARLLGHSLAAAMGFCGLALISLIPVGVVRVLIWVGMESLAVPLHTLENLLLAADVALFAVVFLSGVIVFAAETLTSARHQIKRAWKEHDHE